MGMVKYGAHETESGQFIPTIVVGAQDKQAIFVASNVCFDDLEQVKEFMLTLNEILSGPKKNLKFYDTKGKIEKFIKNEEVTPIQEDI